MINDEKKQMKENPESLDIEIDNQPKIDKLGRSYGTGKRKTSIARVWLKPGSGKILVNGKNEDNYFSRKVHSLLINQPINIVGRDGQYDIMCTVTGGGISGQAGAIRHGISKAIVNYEPELRTSLKAKGFLTRDARIVERKKYGKAKARRSFQFSKR